MLRNAQEDDWESKENRPKQETFCYLKSIGRGTVLTPESYFNKNPAGKAKSGNENIYFPGIIIALNYGFFIGMQKLHRTPGPGTIYRISFFQIFVST